MARVVHIMLSNGLGGIQNAFIAYQDALVRLNHDVQAITTPDMAMAAVHMRTLSRFDPVAIARVAKIIQGADVIISHGKRGGQVARAANFIRRCLGKGHVPHVHVLHRYKFADLARYDAVWCVTSHLQSHVDPTIPSRHIPLWINDGAVATTPPPQPKNQVPVIGFVGRLVHEKAADRFIEAIRALHTQGIACVGHVAGDGPLRAELETQARGLPVTFHGWVGDVPALMRGVDVVCVPSRTESFGLVVLEAWAQARCVVASDADGPAEIIRDGETGLIAASPAALADQLAGMIQDAAARQRIADAGWACVRDDYTASARLKTIQDALQAALPINSNPRV